MTLLSRVRLRPIGSEQVRPPQAGALSATAALQLCPEGSGGVLEYSRVGRAQRSASFRLANLRAWSAESDDAAVLRCRHANALRRNIRCGAVLGVGSAFAAAARRGR
jgi:hypothetical protein